MSLRIEEGGRVCGVGWGEDGFIKFTIELLLYFFFFFVCDANVWKDNHLISRVTIDRCKYLQNKGVGWGGWGMATDGWVGGGIGCNSRRSY